MTPILYTLYLSFTNNHAFTQEPVLNWMLNTAFVSGLATVIGVVFSMTGAYALSRFRFRGRELSPTMLLALQAFPGLLAITAYYYLLEYPNLLNTAPLIGLAPHLRRGYSCPRHVEYLELLRYSSFNGSCNGSWPLWILP
jgi:ABC-type maltose transport system permease subunit